MMNLRNKETQQGLLNEITLSNSYAPETVYGATSTFKCSSSLKPNINTSTEASQAAFESQDTANLNEPKQNRIRMSGRQKTNTKSKTLIQDIRVTKSLKTKKALNDWITSYYRPTHILTVQLPDNKKTQDEFLSREHLRQIMVKFEFKLLRRHWNKKHLPFICFAEKGTSHEWHYHILFNTAEFKTKDFRNVIFKTNIALRLPSYTLDLAYIRRNRKGLPYYCTKEMKIYIHGKFDSDRIILSHDLFALPYKN